MTKYVVGTAEPIVIVNEDGDEGYGYIEFPLEDPYSDNHKPHTVDIDSATLFDLPYVAEDYMKKYYGSRIKREFSIDELCVYAVDVKIKIKKRFK